MRTAAKFRQVRGTYATSSLLMDDKGLDADELAESELSVDGEHTSHGGRANTIPPSGPATSFKSIRQCGAAES